ncbi:NAD(P)H-dependent oxidoreductase [Radiobacillus kanasensis]|uniref:NAD(P)H-dependent oxidoreductase n=1 Tax=Radiobacillus kanasensis TaxID=2844358 RepID=UPI001E5B66AA|nr:NAD(P)H-dependent oxidoreductase [Radiobacillus kanasensis]UFU01202.1 NAD(P)H-dependent oxidoreductase [Radiobacillus kanasensis]
MRTLLIVSHPDIIDSYSHPFFLNSLKNFEDVTVHHLENMYSDGIIDVKKEQDLLKGHDRIIFQFPFYWYSSPPFLKHWQDVVLEEGVTHGPRGGILDGKEFGLILMIGVAESEYQAGGNEQYSISELTKPFQALANKTRMHYLPPLEIFQFAYLEDNQKMELLIRYWQKLTMENSKSLVTREKWLYDKLEFSINNNQHLNDRETIEFAMNILEENQTTINNLKIVLDQMYHR